MGRRSVSTVCRTGAALLAAMALGCVSAAPIVQPVDRTVGGLEIMTISGEQRFVLLQSPDDVEKICVAHGPDAVPTVGEGFSLTNAAQGVSADQEVGTGVLGGRSPLVLLARELLYRTCEFSLNYRLGKAEALDLYSQTLQMIQALAASVAGSASSGTSPLAVQAGTGTGPSNSSGNDEMDPDAPPPWAQGPDGPEAPPYDP